MSKNELIWEKHRPYIELLSNINNSYVFVAEKDVEYLFLSPNFKGFGYDPLLLENFQCIDLLETRIHPDDLLVLGNVQKRLLEHLCSLPSEEQTDYKHIFEFRVLNNNQQYVRVISQHQILDRSSNGNLILLGVADISPNQNADENVKFRLINFKTGSIIPFPLLEDINVTLSKRELEILKMVNEGMFSKEISDKLSISIYTVNRHRQNILQKMDVDNLAEAINYARKLGLLE